MSTDMRPTTGDSDWFVNDRFGLFIHWGLYALAARHEWVQSKERVPGDEYEARYFKRFDPDLYNPEQWAAAAANAGMKYFVITTKHHEGFCLWDSKLTDYKSTKAPCQRDLLHPMVDAFRSHNMRVGFYHSLIDWHHPEYFVDRSNHPRRSELALEETPDGMLDQAGAGAAGGAAKNADINAGKDQMKYADYLHGQVRELLSEFGQVDIMWFDFSFPDKDNPGDFARGKGNQAWRSAELVKLIRQLQPNILLDNRLDLPDVAESWDFLTPEQTQPRGWVEHNGQRVVWEACQTLSGSWGYHRDESSFRSVKQLLQTLVDCVSKGGNLLLNVGPTGRGEFDYRALDRLEGIGKWMRRHGRSIYGCTEAPPEFKCPEDCRLTYNPTTNRLYVHILSWPYKHLHMDGAFKERVEYAQLLHDASELRIRLDRWHANQAGGGDDKLTVTLPQEEPQEATIPVIELFLK